jgi:hypothetical protein
MKHDRCLVHVFERPVDMPVRRIAPPAGTAVVLFAREIATSLPQQFHGSAEAISAGHIQVYMRVLVDIFVVDDGRTVDFTDGSFRFVIGLDKVPRYIRLFPDAQQKLSGAQIAACAQIGRMAAGCIGINNSGCDDGGRADQT